MRLRYGGIFRPNNCFTINFLLSMNDLAFDKVRGTSRVAPFFRIWCSCIFSLHKGPRCHTWSRKDCLKSRILCSWFICIVTNPKRWWVNLRSPAVPRNRKQRLPGVVAESAGWPYRPIPNFKVCGGNGREEKGEKEEGKQEKR